MGGGIGRAAVLGGDDCREQGVDIKIGVLPDQNVCFKFNL